MNLVLVMSACNFHYKTNVLLLAILHKAIILPLYTFYKYNYNNNYASNSSLLLLKIFKKSLNNSV